MERTLNFDDLRIESFDDLLPEDVRAQLYDDLARLAKQLHPCWNHR